MRGKIKLWDLSVLGLPPPPPLMAAIRPTVGAVAAVWGASGG